MSKQYIDERWCPNCQKDTQQEVYDSEHERDSSNDRQECTVCRWWYLGLLGKWCPPIEPIKDNTHAPDIGGSD